MKRNKLMIARTILELCKTPQIKSHIVYETHIVYGTGLNFRYIRPYLAEMVTYGFLVTDGKTWTTTPQGVYAVDTFNKSGMGVLLE